MDEEVRLFFLFLFVRTATNHVPFFVGIGHLDLLSDFVHWKSLWLELGSERIRKR